MSRRGALALGAAAAVGIGALADSVLAATPAGATTGTMQYGATNNAGSTATDLTSSATTETLSVENTGAGYGIDVTSTGSAAALIATSNGIYPAVEAFSLDPSTGQHGVFAEIHGFGAAVVGNSLNPGNADPAIFGDHQGSGAGIKGWNSNPGGRRRRRSSASPAAPDRVSRGRAPPVTVSPALEAWRPSSSPRLPPPAPRPPAPTSSVSSTSISMGQCTHAGPPARRGPGGRCWSEGPSTVPRWRPTSPSPASSHTLGITNTSSGSAIAALSSGASSLPAITAEVSGASGGGIQSILDDATNISASIYAQTSGIGPSVEAVNANTGNGQPSVAAVTHGTGPAVYGQSTSGYGAELDGGVAPLLLTPASVAGPPTTGAHVLGELYVDSTGVLYRCAAAGTPGTWVPQYSTVPLPSPVRVLATPSGTGGISGPLVPGATVHTSSVLTGANGIPAGAVGIVANLAVSGVGGALLNGFGVMTIFPAGTATPATANINAGAGCFALSNTVTVAFGTGANAGKVSIVWNGGGAVPNAQAYLDVTAYIL